MHDTPLLLYRQGVRDLISVSPPDATLAPTSRLSPSQLGKAPALRNAAGLYHGYNWRAHVTREADVESWLRDGANIGLRADHFPAVDIDSLEPLVAQLATDCALATLGPAPRRVGQAPKTLLMYRTHQPFGRMRLFITRPGDPARHMIEVLGVGQQYLIHGMHPRTRRAYTWLDDVVDCAARGLHLITLEDVDRYFSELSAMGDVLGWISEREGDGRLRADAESVDQEGLKAPSLELLREAVDRLPNPNTLFPTREDYLRVGYAIKAAAGSAGEAEGLELFAAWAGRWDGGVNDPETVLADWRRMRGAKKVGWAYLAELARQFGFDDTAQVFDTIPPSSTDEAPTPVRHSEQWLAQRVAERRHDELRYLPSRGQFLVWDGVRWVPDAVLLAEDIVKEELREVATQVLKQGVTPKEVQESRRTATSLCSAQRASNVRQLLQSERVIAMGHELLDHNPWALNTPAGVVDLRTGVLGPADPDQLCTRSTLVAPDTAQRPREWLRFLQEATGGDAELIHYLQKLGGYCLTGSTREQTLTFIWGPGGNGKSVFLNTLLAILGDYARTAPMDTFTASHYDRHSTDLAMLQGARLVAASETQAGKRWDEQRVKAISSGEPTSARYMRQDYFTFTPVCKLLFIGNHRPEIRDVDAAMRRRIHMLPFTVTPAAVDRELAGKLREEYPGILQWLITGCLAWQAEGLAPPAIVQASTQDYFEEQDALGLWMEELVDAQATPQWTRSTHLYERWEAWANRHGEYVGTQRRFSMALEARRVAKRKAPGTRQAEFLLTLKPEGLTGEIR